METNEQRFQSIEHNNEQRFQSIEQSLSTLPLIQKSLAGISHFIESNTLMKPAVESPSSPALVEDCSQVALSSSNDTYSVRNVRIDFPRFAGSDALQWIFQAEQFFDYYGVPDNHRLKIASVHLDGEVVPWFQRLQKAGKLTSWQAFTKSLECTYGPSIFDCPRYSLFRLTQDGSVAQFYAHFTALANRVDGVPEQILLDCFVSGLRKEL